MTLDYFNSYRGLSFIVYFNYFIVATMAEQRQKILNDDRKGGRVARGYLLAFSLMADWLNCFVFFCVRFFCISVLGSFVDYDGRLFAVTSLRVIYGLYVRHCSLQ
jgi:hypothetical protein